MLIYSLFMGFVSVFLFEKPEFSYFYGILYFPIFMGSFEQVLNNLMPQDHLFEGRAASWQLYICQLSSSRIALRTLRWKN